MECEANDPSASTWTVCRGRLASSSSRPARRTLTPSRAPVGAWSPCLRGPTRVNRVSMALRKVVEASSMLRNWASTCASRYGAWRRTRRTSTGHCSVTAS
jgi:hypothetical protein